jgi:hypothetical protein
MDSNACVIKKEQEEEEAKHSIINIDKSEL